tara:strand:+ start:6199 stop:7512 length:1314 start_codon:yes stop_codon:yes gene_type:complete
LAKGYLQRKAAWEILLKVSAGIYSDLALEKVLINYKFNQLDIAFITEISFGCIRYRKLLDLWIDHTSKLNHNKQPPKLRWLLHIGLYQLLKMDKIPFSAAISTSVEVAKKTDLKALSGVVNAVLRNASQKLQKKDLPFIPDNQLDKISYLESLPTWLVKEIIDWFGVQKSINIASSFNKRPTIDLRINPLKTSVEEILEELKKENIEAIKIKDLKNGIQLKTKSRSIRNLPGYEEGKWVIQDRSSQWVATLLDPQKDEKILDACAAPGSKTSHLAEIIEDKGEIWALDRSQIRLNILRENLNRLNIKSVQIHKEDATNLLNAKPDLNCYFDKILIDAPCSGIGTFARNPDARWSLNKSKINKLILLQEKLLNSIFPLLKKTGTLVYSTCTICPGENNLLIKNFLENNNNINLVSEKQILPSRSHPGDGFYAAVMNYL